MRISKKEHLIILNTAEKYFGNCISVYLFGSRTKDNMRGGDIDLYIYSPSEITEKLDKKVRFLTELKSKIGEQKIDLVLSKNKLKEIEKKAICEGIKL